MGGTELTTNSCLTLRYDRKAEPCHKDAFVQQHVTHFDCRSCLTDDYRHDRCLSRQRLEPRLGDRAPKGPGVLVELLHQLRMMLEMPDRPERARRNRRRQGVRE